MTRNATGCNHADEDINKSEMKQNRKKGGGRLSLFEGDAWNIAAYELVPDL